MITFSDYRIILEDLAKGGHRSRTIASLRDQAPQRGSLFLKHDVEARVDRALRMAKIEAEAGHAATYYVQGDLVSGAQDQLRQIASLGHEVTYHYDVLDACDGDYDAAREEFDRYLTEFADLDCVVTTVCPHGNPTKNRVGWHSNKDFFRNSAVREAYPEVIDIVVDFPDIFPNGTYISDAGFQLRVIGQIATNDKTNESAMKDGDPIAWADVAQLVDQNDGLVLSAHPHRFQESALKLKLQRNGFALLKKTYMAMKHLPFVKQAASKFYKLTRRL